MHILSKSKYIRGLQCEKALYLDAHNPGLAYYPPATLAKFRMGRDFERAFKSTFPDGIDISARLGSKVGSYPQLTASLLAGDGEVVLFEAGFQYDGVLVLADVVCKHADGSLEIYEVKNGTAVSETFRRDVAVQHYVVSHALPAIAPPTLFGSGLELVRFYVLYNDGQGGFLKEDQLDYARSQVPQVRDNVSRFKAVVTGVEPSLPMGGHCSSPYDCPYRGYCEEQQRFRSIMEGEGQVSR